MALLQQQQNWFWQQPQQFQPLPYPQYPQYGNFVPNFIFGMVDPPAWVEEEEEEPEAEPAVGAGVEHGPVHDISDDETDEVQPSGPVLPVPEQDGGITAGLIDNQLTFSEVKEADKQSAPVQDRVANLLEKYLKDAHSVMEMDRLAKAHPRVANVEAMKVPRLDEEVYQEVDQKSRATDMTFQSIQKGVLGAMSAFAPVLDLVFLRKQKDKESCMVFNSWGRFIARCPVGGARTLRLSYLRCMPGRYVNTLKEKMSGYTVVTWRKPLSSVKWPKRLEVMRRNQFPGNHQFRQTFQQFQDQPMMMRAYNPFQLQQVRFPSPQNVGYQQSYQQGYPQPQMAFGGYPRQRFNRNQGKQGFAKRGAHK